MGPDEALGRREREALRQAPDRVYRVIVGPDAKVEDFQSDEAGGRRVRVLAPETLLRRQGFSAWLALLEGALAVCAQYGRYFGFYVAVVEPPRDALFWPSQEDPRHVTAYGDPTAFLNGVKEVLLSSSVRLR